MIPKSVLSFIKSIHWAVNNLSSFLSFFFLNSFRLLFTTIFFIYNPQYHSADGKQLFSIPGCILNFEPMLIIPFSFRWDFILGAHIFLHFHLPPQFSFTKFLCATESLSLFGPKFFCMYCIAPRRTLNLFCN